MRSATTTTIHGIIQKVLLCNHMADVGRWAGGTSAYQPSGEILISPPVVGSLKHYAGVVRMRQMFSSTLPLQYYASLHIPTLSGIDVDILKYRLIIRCITKSIGLQRNLTDDEYAALFQGTDPRIDTKFVQVITTLPSFSVEKALAKIEKAEAKIEEAKLEIKEAEAKSGSGSLSAFELNPNVVDAILPSMSGTANPMGVMPSNMKEVAVVDIKNPYFEAVPSLYVRSRYYPPLWDEIKENILSPSSDPTPMMTIVIGQPGIGKSVGFGNYCVLRCMADLPKTIIVVISVVTVNVLVPHNDLWKQYTARTKFLDIGKELCALLKTMGVGDHNALIVHDIRSSNGFKSLPYQDDILRPLQELLTRVYTVLLTSPEESNYGLAMKAGPNTEKYLPVWSREELECAGSFDVQNKFEYCGGVPRSYLNASDYLERKQRRASRAFDPRLMRQAYLSEKCSSVLVKLDIGPDFDEVIGLSPVSMSAERLLRTSAFDALSLYYHDRVQSSVGTDKGLELEKWFMFWIRGSTTTAITCDIHSVSTGVKSTLTVSPDRYVLVGGNTFQGLLEAANQCNLRVGQSVLVQPKLVNFPVVDLLLFTKIRDKGIVWKVDAFQVTVSTSHAPAPAPAKEFSTLFELGGSCKLGHFVWVGVTARVKSAGPNGVVTSTQKVLGGAKFFPNHQYRLDMAQVVPNII